MPRQPRIFPPHTPIHIRQRGNNRQAIFHRQRDAATYAKFLQLAACVNGVQINGWVLMTNHVHLLLSASSESAIPRCMKLLGGKYVRYFNDRWQRTGTLFEGRYSSTPICDTDYFLECLRYIELNPVRAGMVSSPDLYRWSSYRAHGIGIENRLLTSHREYQELARTGAERRRVWREYVAEGIEARGQKRLRPLIRARGP